MFGGRMSCNWKGRGWKKCPVCRNGRLVSAESQRRGICGMCERLLEEKMQREIQKVRE
jgi:hypothetical protein